MRESRFQSGPQGRALRGIESSLLGGSEAGRGMAEALLCRDR